LPEKGQSTKDYDALINKSLYLNLSSNIMTKTYLFSPIYRIKEYLYMEDKKIITIIGRIASVTAVLMYVSYISQIMHNLADPGHGDWIQPMVAGINCVLWVLYGLFKSERDWPIVIANFPGIIFGFIAAFTALL
jgi:integral membrane protein